MGVGEVLDYGAVDGVFVLRLGFGRGGCGGVCRGGGGGGGEARVGDEGFEDFALGRVSEGVSLDGCV